jgi:hypothetical protein
MRTECLTKNMIKIEIIHSIYMRIYYFFFGIYKIKIVHKYRRDARTS